MTSTAPHTAKNSTSCIHPPRSPASRGARPLFGCGIMFGVTSTSSGTGVVTSVAGTVAGTVAGVDAVAVDGVVSWAPAALTVAVADPIASSTTTTHGSTWRTVRTAR
ncbi:MAG: hypothetical protein R2755_06130 [Acidimicrobiales bacterium]